MKTNLIPFYIKNVMNEQEKKMNSLEYVLELSKIIAVDGKVDLNKLDKISELNNKFYNN